MFNGNKSNKWLYLIESSIIYSGVVANDIVIFMEVYSSEPISLSTGFSSVKIKTYLYVKKIFLSKNIYCKPLFSFSEGLRIFNVTTLIYPMDDNIIMTIELTFVFHKNRLPNRFTTTSRSTWNKPCTKSDQRGLAGQNLLSKERSMSSRGLLKVVMDC